MACKVQILLYFYNIITVHDAQIVYPASYVTLCRPRLFGCLQWAGAAAELAVYLRGLRYASRKKEKKSITFRIMYVVLISFNIVIPHPTKK